MMVFVDSDVIISSLLSDMGAAYLLLHNTKIETFISSISQEEILAVMKRLDINKEHFEKLQKNYLRIIPLLKSKTEISKHFSNYTFDENDAHVVAGAKEASARFLITYNFRDYNIEKIKKDFNIIVISPGQFLQYLRSQAKSNS